MSLFRKKTAPSSFAFLGADIHSHLIPGIDDGAQTPEQSLPLILGMMQLGFNRLVITPHIMPELYPNTPDTILAGFQRLKTALKEAGIEDIRLAAAAEYYMDETFATVIASGGMLHFGPQRYVLVEMSELAPPKDLETYIFTLQIKGYQPILAHPERYLFYRGDFSTYERLKELGCLMQVNLPSFSGYYGKPVKEIAFKLLERGLADFAGTDLHHERQLTQLQSLASDKKTMRLLHNYPFRNDSIVV